MTVEELAQWLKNPNAKSATGDDHFHRSRNSSGSRKKSEIQLSPEEEKRRWEAAVNSARERGLDKGEGTRKNSLENVTDKRGNSKSRRNPMTHANILIKETSFSSKEIAEITGLDIYKIIAMKLKSRNAA